jgi:hypothetical protein
VYGTVFRREGHDRPWLKMASGVRAWLNDVPRHDGAFWLCGYASALLTGSGRPGEHFIRIEAGTTRTCSHGALSADSCTPSPRPACCASVPLAWCLWPLPNCQRLSTRATTHYGSLQTTPCSSLTMASTSPHAPNDRFYLPGKWSKHCRYANLTESHSRPWALPMEVEIFGRFGSGTRLRLACAGDEH